MTLKEKRIIFTALLAETIQFINRLPGVRVAIDEARVMTPRVVRLSTGELVLARDAVHGKKGTTKSFHNDGLAVDLVLYRNGDYIADGNDPVWKEINTFCRRLDPWFGLGIAFNDANHLSLGERREEPV